MRRWLILLLALGLTGCGGGTGKVKGKLVNGGEPVGPPAGEQLMLIFHLLGPDDKPEVGKLYPIGVGPDGSFELVAAGGQLPPGKYMLTLDIMPLGDSPPGWRSKLPFQGKFTLPDSPLRADVVGGRNSLVVDLAKPAG